MRALAKGRLTPGSVAIGAAVVAAFVLSALAGTPRTEELPEVALSWPLLLVVERAVALLAISVVTFTFALRIWIGELPIEVGNVVFGRLRRRQRITDLEVEDRLLVLEVLAGLRPPDELDSPIGRG